MKKRKNKISKFFAELYAKIRKNRISFAIYTLLQIITVAVIVITATNHNWSGTFTGVLALILFLLPAFVEKSFRIELPTTLEIIVILFVFCAEILGEIGMYYTKYPFWDNMLHCTSGFIFAAFGFSLVDICNRDRRMGVHLSPFFLSLVAFCFSLAVGVVWEFFEFGMDILVHTDMQKDFLLGSISTGAISPDGQTAVLIQNIQSTAVTLTDGTTYTFAGYLDIGLMDTMKDLLIDTAGALIFSTLGYFYVKHRGKKGKIVKQFIPKISNDATSDTTEASQ